MPVKRFALFLCLSVLATAATAQNFSWKKVRVLVYDKNGKGYVHASIPYAVRMIMEFGKENGFAVDTANDPSVFTEANLKRYNALVFTSTNNEVFDNDDQKVALMRYTQAGGGFIGIHSVTGTERKWEWMKRLIGGTFTRHSREMDLSERVIDAKSPIVKGFPDHWTNKEECYFMTTINPDLHVLLAHDLTNNPDTAKLMIYGNSFPSTWTHEFDGGRQFTTVLGHEPATYSIPVFRNLVLNGLRWVVEGQRPLDYSKAHAKSPDDPLPY